MPTTRPPRSASTASSAWRLLPLAPTGRPRTRTSKGPRRRISSGSLMAAGVRRARLTLARSSPRCTGVDRRDQRAGISPRPASCAQSSRRDATPPLAVDGETARSAHRPTETRTRRQVDPGRDGMRMARRARGWRFDEGARARPAPSSGSRVRNAGDAAVIVIGSAASAACARSRRGRFTRSDHVRAPAGADGAAGRGYGSPPTPTGRRAGCCPSVACLAGPGQRAARRGAQVASSDPYPQRPRPHHEQERRGEGFRFSVDAGVQRSRSIDRERRCGPARGGQALEPGREGRARRSRVGRCRVQAVPLVPTARSSAYALFDTSTTAGSWYSRPASSTRRSAGALALGPRTTRAVSSNVRIFASR